MSSPDAIEDVKVQDTDTAKHQHDDTNNQEPELEGDEAARLAALGAGVRDQEDLERDIGQQADQALAEQTMEREQKRLDKTQNERARMQTALRLAERNLAKPAGSATKNKYRAEIEHYKVLIANLDKDLDQIQKRIAKQQTDDPPGETLLEDGNNKRMPGESHRDFLIRTGKITPFSKLGQRLLRTSSSLGEVLLDAEEEGEEEEEEEEDGENVLDTQAGPKSHRNLLAPGFEQDETSAAGSAAEDTEDDAAMARRLQDEEDARERPAKRRRLQSRREARAASREPDSTADDSDAFVPEMDEDGLAAVGQSGDDDEPQDEDVEGDFSLDTPGTKRKRRGKQKATVSAGTEQEDFAGVDDGNEDVYHARLESWISRRSAARQRHKKRVNEQNNHGQVETGGIKAEGDEEPPPLDEVEEARDEWEMPHPTRPDAAFDGGFRIPGDIYPSLFDYQKTGVQWLWELYSQQVGGIVGDEMGLGKTIQVISFLAGLHYSGKITKPVIVLCPATLLKQWVDEFHRWWPPLRVTILHSSGSGMLDMKREARYEDDLEDDRRRKSKGKVSRAVRNVIDRVVQEGHVLVTTYAGLVNYAEQLLPINWEYCVLDEGHKIRNPNAEVTIFCKEIMTHNRIILSGTPMQNNLEELWTLFDFVFPMRLGTLVNFKNQFAIPIKQGGYANASNLQVETAMKCAETLKDAISPYLLQRFKADVATDLPKKIERVLFCKLTKLQRDAYQWFLDSEDMKSIMSGKRQALYGVDILRKICNHPDLVEHKTLSKKAGYDYGIGSKSGKMQVVRELLKIWKDKGHKTLLFAQHRIMLDILERFISNMPGINYRRMDGTTDIKHRQDLVNEFNHDPDLHVFLLTTKVGGLGVNLTGANRVIIYDPDWNPSTDVQARERAWRLGQKREVEIYRLMTAGTIEEKIYHRQLFKLFLTNKILRDPKQRQNFQLKDLHDLFTLGESVEGQTETGTIFKGTEVKLKRDNSLPTPPDEDGSRKDQERVAINDFAGISRQEDFRGDKEDEETSKIAEGEPSADRVLSGIFARAGVQGAQDHEAIINGRRTVRADPEMIRKEAKKVADEAARELKRAAEVARSLPAGVPTWTGQVGTAGRPPSPPPRRGGMRGGRGGGMSRGGPSSSSVLANLQNRQANASNTTTATPSASTSTSRSGTPAARGGRADRGPQGTDFMKLIRDYIVSHGGAVYSQMLVDHFNRYCNSPQRTAEFSEMLKKIATMQKGGRMRAKWVLKDEYRSGAGGSAGASSS
ncbi:putative helicase, P-loop containing nucleoside triphosphate hydrolase, SNF2-like domain superfamily [Septoria linicola]|nr:putative helicase, P-loop containing nucleoside triphosphate hydrolase, SNF2-like domain superfamily [Septoria linicola]